MVSEFLYTLICFVAILYFLYILVKNLLKLSFFLKENESSVYLTKISGVPMKPKVSPETTTSQYQDDISWETRRDLGRHESYLAELDCTQDTNIYAVISLKSRVSLRRELVQNALVLLSRKHPLLRTIVDTRARGCSFYENAEESGKGRKQFVVMRDRYFLPELRFVNTTSWEIVLDEELSLHRSESSCHGHLWRAILLREGYHAGQAAYKNTILFFFDQVIMDKVSVVEFIKDFRSLLCKLTNCDMHISDTIPLKLQECTEELLNPPPFWKLFMKSCEEKYQNLFDTRSPGAIPEEKHSPEKRKLSFLTRYLSEEETVELLNYTLHNNISIASLFVGAWAMYSNFLEPVQKTKVEVVTNFRKSLVNPVQPSSLGNYSSNITVYLNTSLNQRKKKFQFWESVKGFDTQVKSAIKDDKHLDFLWSTNYPKSDGNFQTFEIADVIDFDVVHNHPFLLEDVYIGASGTSDVSLTLVLLNNRLYCGMHIACRESSMNNHLLNDLLITVQECLRTGLA